MTHATGLSNVNFYYVPAQGGYHLIPMPVAQPPVALALQLPALHSIDATGRRSLQRSAFAPVQNLPTLEPQPLAASPHISVGLEKFLPKKTAEQERLASLENNSVSTIILMHATGSPSEPSNLFYTRLPTSPGSAPILRAELPPLPCSPQPQQPTIPVAAAQALPQQQGTQPSLKRQAAGEPGHLDFRSTTPASYKAAQQAAQQARAEKRARASQQDLPQTALPKILVLRKRIPQSKEKPAAARPGNEMPEKVQHTPPAGLG